MPGKIKGAGGLGQWDLQTATKDVRATTQPTPRASGRSSTTGGLNPYSGPGLSTPLRPGDKGYVPLRTTGRKTGRGKRKGRGSGRKTR